MAHLGFSKPKDSREAKGEFQCFNVLTMMKKLEYISVLQKSVEVQMSAQQTQRFWFKSASVVKMGSDGWKNSFINNMLNPPGARFAFVDLSVSLL